MLHRNRFVLSWFFADLFLLFRSQETTSAEFFKSIFPLLFNVQRCNPDLLWKIWSFNVNFIYIPAAWSCSFSHEAMLSKRPGLSKPWMRIEGKHCNPQHMDRSLCIFDRNLSQLSRSQYLLSTKKIANVSGKKGKLSWNPSWIIG